MRARGHRPVEPPLETFEEWWVHFDLEVTVTDNFSVHSLKRLEWLGVFVRNVVARIELTKALVARALEQEIPF